MMGVTLRDTTPDPPKEGQAFTCTAYGGSPDYIFRYRIGDGDAQTVTQSSPEFSVSIPSGTAGQIFAMNVKDGNNDVDGYTRTITT